MHLSLYTHAFYTRLLFFQNVISKASLAEGWLGRARIYFGAKAKKEGVCPVHSTEKIHVAPSQLKLKLAKNIGDEKSIFEIC